MSLPEVAIFDLDGTLAKNVTNRGFYDWDRVGEDDIVPAVARIARLLHADGVNIVYVTGRDERCRTICEQWLSENNLPPGPLYMRPAYTYNEDSEVKLSIYKEHVEGQFTVVGCFDDRLQVARLWHSLGLPLFRVGDPEAVF